MTDLGNKDEFLEKVTTSVSNVNLSEEETDFTKQNDESKNSNAIKINSALKSSNDSSLQLGGSPEGNLNLPHIQPVPSPSAESSTNVAQHSATHVIEKTGNHSSLEDLEILSTIGKFSIWLVIIYLNVN